ncbi:MAG TPA: hypothetical protein VG294_07810 [Solirubrobacteraceae bacterium]|nr:hypothetical protein [Solirubrobacteraceae bacterium]
MLTELSPVAPPSDTIEAIKTIASDHDLNHAEVAELIQEFLAHYAIDPGGHP